MEPKEQWEPFVKKVNVLTGPGEIEKVMIKLWLSRS
jgi:hypothetical protein